MIRKTNPRQKRLFDPFQGLFTAADLKILANGWQGLLRYVLLELMPVDQLARHFSAVAGAPTKELHSTAALVLIADFFGWTNDETIENFRFRFDLKFALNVDPGYQISLRSLERYQKLFRDDDLAAVTMASVTAKLAEVLEIDVQRQRLDSTHVSSHMARFGRTRLLAVTARRFLTQLQRHEKADFDALPEDFRARYALGDARLFADSATPAGRDKSRQQAAEDLRYLIDRFADREPIARRTTYKNMVAVFGQQCEVVEKKVRVRILTGGDRIQNTSDPDATFDGHKGPGYQVQISETCSDRNDVQLITTVIPQTACEHDSAAVVPVLDQLENSGFMPRELLADTAYAGDENVQAAEARGVELIGPVPGRGPDGECDPEALTVDDFAYDETTGMVDACPAGVMPAKCDREAATAKTRIEMPASACTSCPLLAKCPVRHRKGVYVLEFTDRQRRVAGRRVEQKTDVFRERYAIRSGIESTNSGLKNRLRMGRLRVRGRGSVFRIIQHKIAGWNILRAAASEKVRALVAERMAAMSPWFEDGQNGHIFDWIIDLKAVSVAARRAIQMDWSKTGRLRAS